LKLLFPQNMHVRNLLKQWVLKGFQNNIIIYFFPVYIRT